MILPYYDRPSDNPRYVLGPADVSGDAIANAEVILTSSGQYQVQLSFTTAGSSAFDKVAAQRFAFYQNNPNNPPYQSLEALELDGVVYSAPTIQAASFNGTAVISGSTSAPFSYNQAKNIVVAIKAARS
ncbi:MAG TPA: hypothetical protein VFV02_12835 [Acidimicrobiales bacterium]|nr:hypothetical protein [Acidimicrobiales bacterium]